MSKIKFLPLVLFILLFSGFSVQAEEEFECYLAEEALESPFVLEGSDAVTVATAKVPNDLQFNHTIKLKDGAVVSYSAGGCTHYQQFFKFSDISLSLGVSLDDAALEQIIDLFKALPFQDEEGEYTVKDLEFLRDNKNNPKFMLCDDCVGEGSQIDVYNEDGKIISLAIDDIHAFTLLTDFPL